MSATGTSYFQGGMRGGERLPAATWDMADPNIRILLKDLLNLEGISAHTRKGRAVSLHPLLAGRNDTVSATGKHVCLVVSMVRVRSLVLMLAPRGLVVLL